MDKVFNKIFFDFDSTLIRGESLDMLADMRGVDKEVKKMTELSMNGLMPLEKVLKKKLDMISPSITDIRKLIEVCRNCIVEDVPNVLQALNFLNKEVLIVSSNFRCIIDPIAHDLGIAKDRIIANDIYFNEQGNYQGINESSPLCSSFGKTNVVRQLLNHGDRSVFIGDSSTDIACKNIVNVFVGFGGVVERPVVRDNADVYLSHPSLAPLLCIILHPSEIAQLRESKFAGLLEKAQKLVTTTTTTTASPPSSW